MQFLKTFNEKQGGEFDEKLGQYFRNRYDEVGYSEMRKFITSSNTQLLKSFLEVEVGRLEEKKRKDDSYPHSEESNCADCEWNRGNDFGYNQSLNDQITHYKTLIKELN